MRRFVIARVVGLLAGVTAYAASFTVPGFTLAGAGPFHLTAPNFASCNFTVPTTFKNVWYIDPVNGQAQSTYTTGGISLDPTVSPHQGDITHPWKDLNALLTTIGNAKALGYPLPLVPGGIVNGGDEVLLQSGTAAQYGVIGFGVGGFLYNQNGPFITFKPAPGATVTFAQLIIGNFSNVVFGGINIQSAGKYPLLKVSPGLAENMVFDSMNISTTDAATAQTWTQAQWAAASNGVQFTSGPCVAVTNSHIFNVATGVGYSGGTNIVLKNNEIDHVSQDAIDWDGLDLLIDGNYVHDFPNAGAGDHIDAMQGVAGIRSIPETQRVAITNNTIIWRMDPNLPFPTGSFVNGAIDAGGCCWTDWQVTNNKIYWPNFVHAISQDHCTNCVIENNTLAGGFITLNGGDVNMLVKNNLVSGLDCKNGDQAGVQMQHNIMYKGGNGINILCFGGVAQKLTGATPKPYIGNNISDTGGVLSELTAANPATFTFDFHLLPTAPARGFGLPVDFTPAVDSLGNALNSPPDVGAIQFQQ